MKKILFIVTVCLLPFASFGQINHAKQAADSIAHEQARQAFWTCHSNTDGEEQWIKMYLREKKHSQATSSERNGLVKEYGATIAERMMNYQAWIGMTDKMCLREFTEPNSRKATYTKSGKTEVWIYQGQAAGCIGSGCPDLDYIITFKEHKAIAITTGD